VNRSLIWKLPLSLILIAVLAVTFLFLDWLAAIGLGIMLLLNIGRPSNRASQRLNVDGERHHGIVSGFVFRT